MKNIDTKISILNNTNRIISSSAADWAALRQNSNIFIANDKMPYTIAESKPFFYIRSFSKVGDQVIKIEDSIKHNLLPNDVIDLSYKEYYVIEATLLEDADASGEKTINHNSFSEPITIKTTKGSKNVEILNGGKCLSRPEIINDIKLNYVEFSDRKVIKYEVVQINTNESTLLLNKPLPKNVTEGKISVQKWEAFLNSPYMGHDKINVSCHISRDRTPYLDLPMVPTFGPAQSAVINEIVKKLDFEIQQIKNKVGL